MAYLSLQGYKPPDIAELMGVSLNIVSRVLIDFHNTALSQNVKSKALQIAIQLECLQMLERECWEGYQRSKSAENTDDVQQTLETLQQNITRKSAIKKIRTRNRDGNVSFLSMIFNIIQERSKILALYDYSAEVSNNASLDEYIDDMSTIENSEVHDDLDKINSFNMLMQSIL